MLVSFCIPAHNEERHLAATIGAIRRAAGEIDHEIVVADDASTDRTAAIAASHGARVISIERRQIAAARNAAGRCARGDILIFVDADTAVTGGAVNGAISALRRGFAGGGAEVRFDGEVPRYASVLLSVTLVLFRVLGYCGGCFVFCTRSTFDAIGGWDETLFASEEIAFAKALKSRGRFTLLRSYVVTSGRKLRTHRPAELIGVMLKAGLSGGRTLRTRQGLDVWYGPRRVEPGTDTPPPPE